MKNPQLITIVIGLLLTAGIYLGVRKVPKKSAPPKAEAHAPDDGHNHGAGLTIDTFLAIAKRQLTAEQSARISQLENSISRGAVKVQQVHVYHQLARFYYDTVNAFEPYAWYTAEAARLENSEKSLTFAARLFLDKVMGDGNDQRRYWMASQSKDLFERSLTINPANDSAKVGLGASMLFGGLSANPMVDALPKIREVADRDSTNVYAQMTLVQGALMSNQYDRAITRLQTVIRLQPGNPEPELMLADVYERTGKKKEAVDWYTRSLPHIADVAIKNEVRKRIEELRK